MDENEFKAEMIQTGLATSEYKPGAVAVYARELKHLEIDQFKHAMAACRRELDRFPTVKQILERLPKDTTNHYLEEKAEIEPVAIADVIQKELDDLTDEQLEAIFDDDFSVKMFRRGNQLYRRIAMSSLGHNQIERGCQDCHGVGSFAVVCMADMKKSYNNDLDGTVIDICRNSLLVACPTCELGQWTLKNKMKDHQYYRKNMFPLGKMDKQWFEALHEHAKKHLKPTGDFAEWSR